jgi:hypothetical protein
VIPLPRHRLAVGEPGEPISALAPAIRVTCCDIEPYLSPLVISYRVALYIAPFAYTAFQWRLMCHLYRTFL